MYFPYFENFVVNLPAALRAAMRAGWIGTNLIVNFAENSFGSAVRRLTWSSDHCNE